MTQQMVKNIRYKVFGTLYHYNANDVLVSIGQSGMVLALLNPKDPLRADLPCKIEDEQIYWSRETVEDLKEYVTKKRAGLIDQLLRNLPRTTRTVTGYQTGSSDVPFDNDLFSFVKVSRDGRVVLLDKDTGDERLLTPTIRVATSRVIGKCYIDRDGCIKEGDKYRYCRTSKDGKYFNIYTSYPDPNIPTKVISEETEELLSEFEEYTNYTKPVDKSDCKHLLWKYGLVMFLGSAIGSAVVKYFIG